MGCFEDPVIERLQLRLSNERIEIRQITTLDRVNYSSSSAVGERIDQISRELSEGRSLWHERFKSVAAVEDQERLTRRKGQLEIHELWAHLDPSDPDQAARFEKLFAKSPIQASLTRGPGHREITLVVHPEDRATPGQREALRRARREFTSAVEKYLRSAHAVWSYAAGNPERANAMFAAIFADLGDFDTEELEGDREKALTEALEESMEAVLVIFEEPQKGAYSIQELSRLVYDPFPARLSLQIASPVLEAEGFVARGNTLDAPPRSLFDALHSLRDVWLTPDPLFAQVEYLNQPTAARGGFRGGLRPGRVSRPGLRVCRLSPSGHRDRRRARSGLGLAFAIQDTVGRGGPGAMNHEDQDHPDTHQDPRCRSVLVQCALR